MLRWVEWLCGWVMVGIYVQRRMGWGIVKIECIVGGRTLWLRLCVNTMENSVEDCCRMVSTVQEHGIVWNMFSLRDEQLVKLERPVDFVS
jgi:hypothetical protein